MAAAAASASGCTRVTARSPSRTNAPNGTEGIIAVATSDSDALRAGSAEAALALPSGIAPSFDGADLEITYVVRVLVNRKFRPDTAIERPVAVA